MQHINIKVFGQVQGVIFRASAKEVADKLNIQGFARNEAYGIVYIEAEGEEDHLKQFLAWCKKGPQFAQVTSVKITPAELKNFIDFQIQ